MEILGLGIFGLIFLTLGAAFIIYAATSMFKTVDQAHVAVTTVFGKYKRILRPGLNIVAPLIEKIEQKISIQNQTIQLQFSAITSDQAAVHFTATIIFTVSDHEEETIKLVAFKFITPQAFNQALISAVESSVRSFVATKKQAELLGLREEIVSHAKDNLDDQLASWGYLVSDLQITDLNFDPEVMTSMTRVVAAKNAQVAAEFEGQALLIKRTKEAEAEGAAIKIAAENEAEANRLKGQGFAMFRKEIASGLAESAEKLRDEGIDPAFLAFTMWTEMVRDTAREGKGNTIFLDGSVNGLDENMKRIQGMIMSYKNPNNIDSDMSEMEDIIDGVKNSDGFVLKKNNKTTQSNNPTSNTVNNNPTTGV